MAEEKPLFLIDIDRAIEGLLSAAPKNAAGPLKVEPIVLHCVDLANALDGAGLEDLSQFAHELAGQFKDHQAQSLMLVSDFISLVNAGVSQIHPGEAAHHSVSDEVLQAAKTSFAKKLEQLKAGTPISSEPIGIVEQSKELLEPRESQQPSQAEQSISTKESVAPSTNDLSSAEVEDAFPNQEFSPGLFQGLQAKKIESTEHVSMPASQETVAHQHNIESRLDQAVHDLKQLFTPKKESPPVVFAMPEPKAFSLPENLTKPIDRDSAFEYSSKTRFSDRHYALDRSSNLNRMQKARSLVGKGDSWSGVEVDFLLGREQDELVRSGQQSLRHIFDNLTEELLIDEVYADPDIAQQLLTILSILPPCPSIFAVQQELMIFIDLDHVTLSNEHLLAVGGMMAEIGGSLEIHHDGVRLSCPSSLLRMPMAFFTRHGEHYAVSAIQYLGEEPLTRATESKIDFLGEIIHPARSIYVRAGNQDYVIHAHEFLGVQNMNVHQNLPRSLDRPYWMAGVALDGANNVYSWIALDRYAR